MKKEFSLSTKYVTIDKTKCRNCGWCRCKNSCPAQAIGKVGTFWNKHTAFTNPQSCNGCMKCTKACIRNVFSKKQRQTSTA